MTNSQALRFCTFTLFAAIGVLLAACGAGTSIEVAPAAGASGAPGPAATAVATAVAAMSSSGSATGVIVGPAAGSGVSGITLALGAASGNGYVVIGAWNGLPPSTPALTSSVGPSPLPLAYITVTPSVSTSFSTTPGLIVNLGSAATTSGSSYYVAYLPPGATTWQQPLLGPAAFNTSVQLNLPPNFGSGAWQVTSGKTYTYAIYQIPTPSYTDDWTTYAHDSQRTGFETYANGSSALGTITPQNVSSLRLAWSTAPNPSCDTAAAANAVVADEASPLVANGLVYYADTCGYVAALDRTNGNVVWHYQANVVNQVDGVLGTPVIDNGLLIVPVWGDPGNCANATLLTCDRANGGYLLALDAMTGAMRWRSAPLALGNMRGEPFVLNGEVYEGIAGGDDTSGYVNGGLAVYNESSGAQIGATITFAPPGGTFGTFDGGSSWTPITYDGTNIYLGTGNTRDNLGLQDGVLQFTPQNGGVPVASNNYSIMTYDNLDDDEDVGGGIMLYGGSLYFTGKNGNFYGYSTSSAATPLFKTLINPNPLAPGKGGIGTPTTDGAIVTASSGYNSCTTPNVCTQSDLDCFQLGAATPFGKLQASNSAIYGYAAFVKGVGFIGIDNGATAGVPTGGAPVLPEFVAFDDSCHVIWKANPLDLRGFFYGGPAVVPSGVYAIDNAGNVYAWKLPYQMGFAAHLPLARRLRQTPFSLLRSTHYTSRRRL